MYEEIKCERKDMEGFPEFKGCRKSMYCELIFNKVLKEVLTVDVVVINFMYYVVVLRYI